jgi:uracil-DNA glycosylase
MAEAALRPSSDPLAAVVAEIRACRICAGELVHGVRPVLRASPTARLCIVGQAPGIRVHESGIPFNDPSGERLRDWMGVDRDTFYDENRIAIVPMGFCFPGYDRHGGDKPPRKECARQWRAALFAELPAFPLTLVIGSYAMRWHLDNKAKKSVSDTVRAWRDYAPSIFPLPHPSWRNNAWLKKNPWFETELLPQLRARVQRSLR